jgi:hypothetical protein
MKKVLNTNPPGQMPDNNVNYNLQEYPLYPESEDIYNRFKKEKNMDPEDISKVIKSDNFEMIICSQSFVTIIQIKRRTFVKR